MNRSQTSVCGWRFPLWLALWGAFWSPTAVGQAPKPASFRIDTDIYLDESKPPVKRTLTLFSEGVYYDFDETDEGQVTVIDPAHDRIVLLDRVRQVKSTLNCKQLHVAVTSARVQADAKITSVSESSFDSKPNGDAIAILRNDFLEYKGVVQPTPTPDMATQYADFADWSARLNAVLPPKLPPFLRLDFNRLVAEHQAIPIEIRRRTYQGGREIVMTARLIPVWRLSDDDLAKVARCGGMLAEFKESPEGIMGNAATNPATSGKKE